MSTGAPWVPQYVMSTPLQSVDDSYNLATATGHMGPYKNDGQPQPRGISVMMPSPETYNPMIPQVRATYVQYKGNIGQNCLM